MEHHKECYITKACTCYMPQPTKPTGCSLHWVCACDERKKDPTIVSIEIPWECVPERHYIPHLETKLRELRKENEKLKQSVEVWRDLAEKMRNMR